MSKVRYTELWTVKSCRQGQHSKDEMQADSQHTHEFSICTAVPAQISASRPPEPSFWSFLQELTLHPQSRVHSDQQPTRGFWVHFEKQDFV